MEHFNINEDVLDSDLNIFMWVDDVRVPPKWANTWCQTASDAILLLKTNRVKRISFDHDLGDDNKTGYDVALWIEKAAWHGTIEPLGWAVHSANPVGARNIEMAMQNADKFWESNDSTKTD